MFKSTLLVVTTLFRAANVVLVRRLIKYNHYFTVKYVIMIIILVMVIKDENIIN